MSKQKSKSKAPKRVYTVLAPAARCAVARAYARGEPIADICDKYTIDPTTVRKIATEHSIELRPVGRPARRA